MDRYARLVYAVPVNLGVTGMDAEDVAQATFEALHTSLDRLAEPHRVSAWLVTVARRQTFRVMDKPYIESGIRIDRLWSSLGVGVFYRYGELALPKASDNIAVKLSSVFTF